MRLYIKAIERAIAYFEPNILLFVGIAGGIKDVKIGDVVAATDVYGYESGKVGEGFFTRPKVGKSADRLVQRAKFEARTKEWLQRLSSNSVSKPRVFVAPIAAGEKVVASRHSDIFQFLRASYNDAIALEMEGFGFLSAAFAYDNVQAIVIRGISDLIEGKNDDAIEPEEVRQQKASHHASAFAFEMLSKFQVTDSQSITHSSPANCQPLQHDLNMSNVPMQEPKVDVLDLLNRLLPSQLEAVILRYNADPALLSNETPNQRSIDLIRYARQKEGADLSQLLRVIYKVAPHLKGPPEPPTATIYVERPPIEAKCYQTIVQSGALLWVKGSQQMGKTKLMHRLLDYARTQGYETVNLSFELANRAFFQDLEKFYQWFCVVVGKKLELPNHVADYWEDILGFNYNTTSYFQKYLLAKITKPLVLALDKVDLVFEHAEIAIDFFNLLRHWHDQAKRGDHDSGIWQKLRLVIVHTREVYDSLYIHASPLGGVGVVVALAEFNTEQLQDLAQQNGLTWKTTDVEQLMSLVGGHPYLAQLALDAIKHQGITLDQLSQEAHTEAGIYSHHLRQHWVILKQYPELARGFRNVVTKERPVELDSMLAFKLQSMGLVKLEGNAAKPRCELYRKYFRNHLSS